MDLVQWIVASEDDSALRVGWAPAWADRLTGLGPERRPIRRRGAPLVSRWLPHPLAVGSVDGDPEVRVTVAAGALSLAFALALDGPDARLPLGPNADDIRFAGLYAELVRVVADLCESAALPPTAIAPLPERRGFDIAVGAVGSVGLDNLADSIILVRAALELCAHARGLQLVDARVRYGTAHAPIDGRTRAFLAGATNP